MADLPQAFKGRGAASNPEGRFETIRYQPEDDGWHHDLLDEQRPRPRTQVAEERARSVITHNDSPDIRLAGANVNLNDETKAAHLNRIRRLAPEAYLIGAWSGSVIMRMSSSRESFEFLTELQEAGLLAPILKVDEVELSEVGASNAKASAPMSVSQSDDNRIEILIERISQWRPVDEKAPWYVIHHHFANYLREQLESKQLAHDGYSISQEVLVMDTSSVVPPRVFDFIVHWLSRTSEPPLEFPIEITRFQTISKLLSNLLRMADVSIPMAYVVWGVPSDRKMHLNEQVASFERMNANIRIIIIPKDRNDGDDM